ncbi:hypothetical protein A2U01_0027218, partial [Trifolium medium]|nr:hypothetical protein [Trifolium medium]
MIIFRVVEVDSAMEDEQRSKAVVLLGEENFGSGYKLMNSAKITRAKAIKS